MTTRSLFAATILATVLGTSFIASSAHASKGVDGAFTLEAGVSSAEMQWNIAGNLSGTNPNVLSELTYSDLDAWMLKAGLEMWWRQGPSRNFIFEGHYGIGDISEGNYQDSDYALDNRQLEYSRSIGSAGGDLESASIAIGRRFELGPAAIQTNNQIGGWYIAPLIGWSREAQNIQLTDGVQTIDLISGITGPFAGLNSSYDASWTSGWLGGEVLWLSGRHGVDARISYHHASYEADAVWNLRSDFRQDPSFTQDADGEGLVLRLRYRFAVASNIDLQALVQYEDWSAEDGTDTVYFTDGSVASTRLNEVTWEQLSLRGGVRLRF